MKRDSHRADSNRQPAVYKTTKPQPQVTAGTSSYGDCRKCFTALLAEDRELSSLVTLWPVLAPSIRRNLLVVRVPENMATVFRNAHLFSTTAPLSHGSAVTPPHPNARASVAAHNRRIRSFIAGAKP